MNRWITDEPPQRGKCAGKAEQAQALEGGGRLKSSKCQIEARGSVVTRLTAAVVGVLRMMATVAATGTAQCMTTQTGQWSASELNG